MEANFSRSLSLVLRREGGYVNHPKDPGGATHKGITIGTYRRYINSKGTPDDLRRITDEQVATVYKKHYWDKVKADNLPSGVDYAVFDFAVNSGPSRAAKYLQSVVGVKQDGIVGPETISAATWSDPGATINALCDNRMKFLRGLKTWPTFGKGWTNRVTDVRRHALEMAGREAPRTVQPAVPPPIPEPTPVARSGLLAALIKAIAVLFTKLFRK